MSGHSGRLILVGRTLGHYQINAAIGAGGMGEVYRATDTKLGRDVALKILPPDVASDPERLARFQREARAVAALNHARGSIAARTASVRRTRSSKRGMPGGTRGADH
jgi:serine/threonine protein kinase